MQPTSLACLSASAFLSIFVSAQNPADRDLAITANRATTDDASIRLRYGSFDPTVETPSVPAALTATAADRLWIVQFEGLPTEASRALVAQAGGELSTYLPDNAYVVRMDIGAATTINAAAQVRAVVPYHPAYRLEPFLLGEHTSGAKAPARRYNIIVVNRNDKNTLADRVFAIGGSVHSEQEGSILFQADLDGLQLLQVAHFPEVLWIDRWTPPETDIDNARIQGGADFVEFVGGFTGAGLVGYVYEGIDSNDSNFTTRPIAIDCGSRTGHGHSTATIIFGNGDTAASLRGLVPDASCVYTDYTCDAISRFSNVQTAMNSFGASFKTASWGGTRTLDYTAVSAEADDIVFVHDIAWTQSQSNAGDQMSRPEAWAKNTFSIGGVAHGNNADPSDDSWLRGNGSIGPAADGRIKPTLCAYYDGIQTAGLDGSISGFGGTSGATPICAGFNALAIQMFTDGVFGNTLRNPGGTRQSNRPHFTTLKSMQVANASQYSFNAASTDNRREHVGYGFPNVRSMYVHRDRMLIVDETDVLLQGQSQSYTVTIQPGDTELKVALNWAEPAANPSALQTIINDLDLVVTSPTGTTYRGNNGLRQGNYSTAGGAANRLDTLECVFIDQPATGNWLVTVIAHRVAMDNHTETGLTDIDFGLCATFGEIGVELGSITEFGQGCLGTGNQLLECGGINTAGGPLSGSSNRNEYCIRVTSPTPLTLSGFELLVSGNASMGTALYADVGGSPALTPIRTGSMRVSGGPGFFRTTFAPITIPANTPVYLGADYANGAIVHPQLSSTGATRADAFFRGAGGTGNWSLSGVITRPSVRLLCPIGPPPTEPQFFLSGNPFIGGNLELSLSEAADLTPALLFVGFSNTVWGGGALPFNFASLGAPQCDLLVSPDLNVPLLTDAGGAVSLELTIPGLTPLVGARVFQQFLIVDPGANAGGLVTTRAYEVSIGG